MLTEDRVRLVSLRELYAFYDAADHAFQAVMEDPDARVVAPAEVRPQWSEASVDAEDAWRLPGLPPLLLGALHLHRQGRAFELVDVGANIGLTVFSAAILLRRLGFDAPVSAFEPHPGVCGLLRRGLRANALHEVEAHEVALSDEDGSAVFHMASVQTPASSLMEAAVTREQVEGFDDVEVAVRRFDTLWAGRPVRDLVVKIDAEGADLKVLDGMGAALRDRLCIGQFEFFPRVLRTYADPVAALVRLSRDFALFDMAGVGLRPLEPDQSSLAAYVAAVDARAPVGIGDVFFAPRALPGFDAFRARILAN